MAKYLIEIDCNNAAFDDNPEYELSGILRRASTRLANGEFDFKLRDSNGNTVGTAYLEEDEPDEPDELGEGPSDEEENEVSLGAYLEEELGEGTSDAEESEVSLDGRWLKCN